jgi:hypothetical protein
MLPMLLLLGIGKRRRFWLPLPVILLWPLWLLGWIVWLPLWLLGISWGRVLRQALVLPTHFSGLRMDIDTTNGQNIHVWTI